MHLFRLAILAICTLSLGCATMTSPTPAASPTPDGYLAGKRVVFLGDSITDGHTYPSLVAQALQAAGRPAPAAINAGISGNTAKQMLARLDRDVLALDPHIVTFNCGANDANQKIEPTDFDATLRQIADRIDAAGVDLILITTSPNLTDRPEPRARVVAYAQAMRRLAAERGYRLADANEAMHQAEAAGIATMEADGIHPSLAGYRIMARSILEASGYRGLPVPDRVTPQIPPGLISAWSIRALPDAKGADAASIAAARPDATWRSLVLPHPDAVDSWWRDDERQRGFSPNLGKWLDDPTAKRFLAHSEIEHAAGGPRILNLGGWVYAVWLNGECLYSETQWRGWHLGHERIELPLQPGENTLILEVGEFMATLTPDRVWEDD